MKSFSLPAIIDGTVTAIFGFVFYFITISYFAPMPFSIIMAISLTIMSILLIVKIDLNKHKKLRQEHQKKFEAEEVLTKLDFMSKTELYTLFSKVFEKQNIKFEKRKNYLYLPEEKKGIFFSFGFENKSKAEIVKAYNLIDSQDKAEIYSSDFPKDIKDFASRFGGKISLISGIQIYEMLKEVDLLPEKENFLFPIKEPKKERKVFFTKKRAKSFLSFGTIFLLMSYFVPIKLYYVICGGIMLFIGLFCLFFGKPQQAYKN